MNNLSPVNQLINKYRWLPMLLWMVTIFVISAQPAQDLPDLGVADLLIKKLAHFIAYAILALLALWGMGEGGGKRLPRRRLEIVGREGKLFILALLITALYAMSDEYHQTFVLGRNGMFWDVLIDTTGGLTALWIKWQRAKR